MAGSRLPLLLLGFCLIAMLIALVLFPVVRNFLLGLAILLSMLAGRVLIVRAAWFPFRKLLGWLRGALKSEM